MKEINNEIPCKSAVNSNGNLVISLKELIESLQSEIYFLREEIKQKSNIISTKFKKKSACSSQTSKGYQNTNAKQETNAVELENKVTETNNFTANLAEVADLAIPANVSNLSSKSNTSLTIENIQHTHEALLSIPSNTTENKEKVGSKTAKEQ